MLRTFCTNIEGQMFHWPSLVAIIEYCSLLCTQIPLPQSLKYCIPILLKCIYILAIKNKAINSYLSPH